MIGCKFVTPGSRSEASLMGAWLSLLSLPLSLSLSFSLSLSLSRSLSLSPPPPPLPPPLSLQPSPVMSGGVGWRGGRQDGVWARRGYDIPLTPSSPVNVPYLSLSLSLSLSLHFYLFSVLYTHGL